MVNIVRCFLGAVALVALFGCSSFEQPLLYDVRVDPSLVRPDGTGIAGQVQIHYAVGRRANVTVSVIGADGKTFVIRDSILRAADQYAIRFDGTVAAGTGADRRVLPDGDYSVKVKAVDLEGKQMELSNQLSIRDADTEPLAISNLVVRPDTITPNNDGEDDDSTVSYSLSKKAVVTVFVTDAEGNFALLQEPTDQEGEAGLGTPWDGKENGSRLLANGQYTLHVKAVDKAGNATEVTKQITIENAGTPRMAISKVKFWPPIVPLKGTLHVEITVKNIGDTVIKQLGPDPGTRYSINSSYASFRDDQGRPLYYERPGRWRVGIMWNNAPQPYPVRWGFGKDLAPGNEATVAGDIVIDTELPRTGTYFWAGIEQGGVGFLETNKGQTEIRIAY